MAIGLCRCFLQSLGSSNSASHRGPSQFYLLLVHKIMKHGNSAMDPFQLELYNAGYIIDLTLVSPTFRSLAVGSSIALLAVVMLCTGFSKKYISSLGVLYKSYILQSYKTSVIGSAGNWTRLISLAVTSGLNLTYVLHKLTNVTSLCIRGLIMQINPILSQA
jgi:hypothetical protein